MESAGFPYPLSSDFIRDNPAITWFSAAMVFCVPPDEIIKCLISLDLHDAPKEKQDREHHARMQEYIHGQE
ncbi:MAG: hypothetical protein MUD09_07045 [Desulfobacterales bacterium]|jgi:hypothetical protein|nr:hypothetical protein [Desulfobacterales bacterium]